MLFKLLNLNSNLALNLGYLNLALNNSALVFYKWYYSNLFRFRKGFQVQYHLSEILYRNFPTNGKLLWKGSNTGGRGERGLICDVYFVLAGNRKPAKTWKVTLARGVKRHD